MNHIDFVRQFLIRYFPRPHLLSAGLLAGILLLLVIFSSGGTGQSGTRVVEPLSVPLAVTGTDVQSLETARESGSGSGASTTTADAQSRNSATVYPSSAAGAAPGSGEVLRESTAPGVSSEAEEQPAEPDWQHVEVSSGDNLSTLFRQVGLSDRELFHVLESNEQSDILNRIYPGYKLSFLISASDELQQLKVLKSPMEGYLFTRTDDSYDVESIFREPEVRHVFRHGVITDSLFLAGQREDIPPMTIMEMANIFGGVIDFILDPRFGDNFSILLEENYLDGEFVGTGDIIAAQFTNQDKQFIAVQYQGGNGQIGYYNPNGESMRKPFLRTPLDVFRISSNFSLARRHPILNTIRAHRGTDYAAPRGTPVRATSDGTVTWASRNGSFGNLVVIKHRGGFETKYAHLNGFAKGVKKGSRVRQGDIIGYVGATGSATGPHLHYEFLVNGEHQNPSTILDRLPQTVSIAVEELDSFQAHAEPILERFRELQQSRLLAQRQLGAE